MNRAEKTENLEQLTDRFGRAPIAVVTEYRGLNVAEITELRRGIREAGGEYLVSKNTLARLALKESGNTAVNDLLVGPTAIAFGYADAVALAKAVHKFGEDHDALVIKGGLMDGEMLEAGQVAQLAKMPGRDELRAKLLALLTTPATNLVRLLQTPAQQLAQVLQARASQSE